MRSLDFISNTLQNQAALAVGCLVGGWQITHKTEERNKPMLLAYQLITLATYGISPTSRHRAIARNQTYQGLNKEEYVH